MTPLHNLASPDKTFVRCVRLPWACPCLLNAVSMSPSSYCDSLTFASCYLCFSFHTYKRLELVVCSLIMWNANIPRPPAPPPKAKSGDPGCMSQADVQPWQASQSSQSSQMSTAGTSQDRRTQNGQGDQPQASVGVMLQSQGNTNMSARPFFSPATLCHFVLKYPCT